MTIKNLKCDNGKFYWTVSEDDITKNYCTNENGEGIFEISEDGNHKQLTGTTQFNLTKMSLSGARAKLNKLVDTQEFYNWFNK